MSLSFVAKVHVPLLVVAAALVLISDLVWRSATASPTVAAGSAGHFGFAAPGATRAFLAAADVSAAPAAVLVSFPLDAAFAVRHIHAAQTCRRIAAHLRAAALHSESALLFSSQGPTAPGAAAPTSSSPSQLP